MKRLFDIAASFCGLVVLSPLLVLVGALIGVTSRGPVLFFQERIGRGFRSFHIVKFRTMVQDAPSRGGVITVGDDPRITRVGKILRKCKLDELPQLFNVLKGDMSFVGPRPEAPKYVEMFREDYEEVLRVRPGITDMASIKYREEAAVLAKAEDPERAYVEVVLPEKIKLARDYVARSNLFFDIYVIILTILTITGDRFAAGGVDSVDGSDSER